MSANGMSALCGIGAAVLSLCAGAVYIRDIVRGTTRPSRVTWFALAILNAVLAASYYASGARETVWLPASYAASFLAVAILSIWRGHGGWSAFDVLCFAGAAFGMGLWWWLRSPTAALALLIAVELAAFLPTVLKAYRLPETEHVGAWVMATAASLLNVFAIREWSAAIYAYPLYAVVANALFVGLLLYRRRFTCAAALHPPLESIRTRSGTHGP